MSKIFAIGDIHGCLKELKEMMSKLVKSGLTKNDELVFVGDYIDRGPDSKQVIDYLIKLNEKYKITFLKGNHEQMMEDALKWFENSLWLQNGGAETIRSYGLNFHDLNINSFPFDHIEFFKNLKTYYETEDYIFVHAGIDFKKSMKDQDENDLLWIRDFFISNKTKLKKKVIFGHTIHKEPLVMDNKIGIDTGCFWHGKLTCLELPSMKFYFAGKFK